ncbi:MAG: DNA-binding protein [Bacteroidaceae bacterium]
MINYSIVMRSVNANLFDINQAKSRIKAAQLAGQEPSQTDLDLVATERQNAYAIAQYAEVMTIDKFARHIASHGSVYSRADISAILLMAVDCMREQLLEGKKIRMGDLGDFSVLLSSKGAETADKFTAQNITGVKVVWECGPQFRNLLDDAEFNLVAPRSAQAAVIKAIRMGETTVDLNATDTDATGPGTPDTEGGSRQYTLSVSTADSSQGSVDSSVNGTYDEGARITVTATPAEGYDFDKWSDGNTSASRTVTLNADLTLVASFKAHEEGGSDSPAFD